MESEEAIKHWKNNIDKWWKKRPNLTNTDLIEEIDKDYKAVGIILNQLTKQEKMIELMLEYLEDELTDDICNKENCYADEYIDGHCQKCLNCIKQYFEKKVEE